MDGGIGFSKAGGKPRPRQLQVLRNKICVACSGCRASRVGCKRAYPSTSAAKVYCRQVVGEVLGRPKRFLHVFIPFDRLADFGHVLAWARPNNSIGAACRLRKFPLELRDRDPGKLDHVSGVRWRTCIVVVECDIAIAELCGLSGPATK